MKNLNIFVTHAFDEYAEFSNLGSYSDYYIFSTVTDYCIEIIQTY